MSVRYMPGPRPVKASATVPGPTGAPVEVKIEQPPDGNPVQAAGKDAGKPRKEAKKNEA